MFTEIQEKAKSLFAGKPSENTEQPAAETKVIKVDLHDYGLMKAGATGAEPTALKNLLNDIRNGFIVDENENDAEQIKERENKEKEIAQLIQEKTEKESSIRKINEVQIPTLKDKITVIKGDMNRLEIDKLKADKSKTINKFNLNLYWTVFIFATIFLYAFYLSAFHTAFIKDMSKSISEANGENISELLNQVFNKSAFQEFHMHWLAPVIFYVFGLVIHIVYDAESRHKAFSIGAVLLFILTADCLIAYFIEYNSHLIQVLNGMPTEDWAFYKSPRFYLVLFLGFFTCLGWSIILHAIKGEYLKEDTDLVFRTKLLQLREQEDELNKQVDQLKQEVITIESTAKQLQATIDLKTKQLNNIVYSVTNLEKRITAFYDGWITYVANLRNNAGLIASSESVFGEFKAQYLSRKESSITQLTNS
jgi:hypothetical protein